MTEQEQRDVNIMFAIAGLVIGILSVALLLMWFGMRHTS